MRRLFVQTLSILILLPLATPSIALAHAPDDDRAQAVKRAEIDYLRARVARLEAELALSQYEATYAKQRAESNQARARADNELLEAVLRAKIKDQDAEVNRKRLLDAERAKIVVENEIVKAQVLSGYAMPKTIKGLKDAIEKAAKEEEAKKAAWEDLR